MLPSTRVLHGVVLEVLLGFGLAHVRAFDGSIYGLTRNTPGIRFDDLRVGQPVVIEVADKFARVLRVLR